ncbi:hypothetical protein [Actinomadura madurae]|uniref:hypothetical protein n=1 Tax=Actinomadura madurae TaxID=1993 RepID=UPI0020D20521|nr:hypothetical protein [Actinomadura madurae]MCQ0009012.1 hypothetical protein [Actinomadura madurae]
MPDARSAAMLASVWAGPSWMCDQSTSVVMPESRHSSAPGERPGVDVVRAVAGRQLAEDAGQVGGERAVGEDRAERRLPGVAVRVDEARHDDAAGGVDRLGAGGGGQFSADRGDAAVLDEHVGGAEDGGGGCGVDDEAVRDEE